MSDDSHTFIPDNPSWQPTPEAAEEALALLRSYVEEPHEISMSWDSWGFVCGEEVVGDVRCPTCDSNIAKWFFELLTAEWPLDVNDLRRRLPCCGIEVSLNDLKFPTPAGFSLFSIGSWNQRIDLLSAEQVAKLERTLGSRLRIVYYHV